MGEHTKGPWYAEGMGVFKAIPGAKDSLGTPLLAIYIADCQSNPLGKAESAANARLIAAAPELLAALRDMTAAVNRMVNRRLDEGDFMAELWLPCLQAAELAIAKAEGKG